MSKDGLGWEPGDILLGQISKHLYHIVRTGEGSYQVFNLIIGTNHEVEDTRANTAMFSRLEKVVREEDEFDL